MKINQVIKFLIVGVLNTLLGMIIMFVSYNLLHFGYWISSALNYVLVSIFSYFINKYYTFENHSKSTMQTIKFALNIAVCYFVSYGVSKPFVESLLTNLNESLKDNISMFVGMIGFSVINFIGQKFFVFNERINEPN